jgi:hypothetical protein
MAHWVTGHASSILRTKGGYYETIPWQSLSDPTYIHKATLMKEIERLHEIGVLTWQPASKWAAPSFTILHTISNFRELNKCIVWRSYPIPKISTTL